MTNRDLAVFWRQIPMAGICVPAHLNATELRGSQGALKGLVARQGRRIPLPLVMTNIAMENHYV